MSPRLAFVLSASVVGWTMLVQTPRADETLPLPTVSAFNEVQRLTDLPASVQTLLGREKKGFLGIADRGESFNSTDMIDMRISGRRFDQGWQSQGLIVVTVEVGGIVSRSEIAAFSADAGSWRQSDRWMASHRHPALSQILSELKERDETNR